MRPGCAWKEDEGESYVEVVEEEKVESQLAEEKQSAQRVYQPKYHLSTSPLPPLLLFLSYTLLALVHPLTATLVTDPSALYTAKLSVQSVAYAVWDDLGFAVMTHCALWCFQRASWMFSPPRPHVRDKAASSVPTSPGRNDDEFPAESSSQSPCLPALLSSIKWLMFTSITRSSYAAFLVHPIVNTAIATVPCVQAYATDAPVSKTLVVGTLAVLGSFGVGCALVNIPGVGDVL